MKKISTYLAVSLLLICLTSTGTSAQKSVKRFINDVKKVRTSQVATIPGWLIRTGANWAVDGVSEEEQGYRDIINGIKSLRVAYLDRGDVIQKKDVLEFARLATEKDGMKEYVKVKDKGNDVLVLIKEKKNRIRNVCIVSRGKSEFAIVHIKTNITMDDLKKAKFSFN